MIGCTALSPDQPHPTTTNLPKQVSIEQQRVLDAFLGRGADTPSGGQGKFAWEHGDTSCCRCPPQTGV